MAERVNEIYLYSTNHLSLGITQIINVSYYIPVAFSVFFAVIARFFAVFIVFFQNTFSCDEYCYIAVSFNSINRSKSTNVRATAMTSLNK